MSGLPCMPYGSVSGKGSVRVAIGLVLVAGATCSAAIVTVPSSRDNSIFRDAENNSLGASNGIFAGNNANQIVANRRGLIQFDLASIPAGSFVQSALVRLWLAQENTGLPSVDVRLHRLQSSWGEASSLGPGGGGGGAPAEPGDATWQARFFPGTLWTSPGGDFVQAESASAAVGSALRFYAWSGGTLSSDVQGWLTEPETNFGWILIGDESRTRTAKRFDSRESTIASQRPVLQVSFLYPGDATGDDEVNLDDFTILAANFGASNVGFAGADFNRDGMVSLDDFTILAANFSTPLTAPQTSAVPEATLLLFPASLVMTRLRRHPRTVD